MAWQPAMNEAKPPKVTEEEKGFLFGDHFAKFVIRNIFLLLALW